MRTIFFYLLCFAACFLLTWDTIVLVDGMVQVDGNWMAMSGVLCLENVIVFFLFNTFLKKK